MFKRNKLFLTILFFVSILHSSLFANNEISSEEAIDSRQNLKFSLTIPSQEKYIAIAKKIPPEKLANAYKYPYASQENAFIYALAHDFAYSDSNMLPYYDFAFSGKPSYYGRDVRLEIVDYLIRVNRIELISQYLSLVDCTSTYLGNKKCGYYYGLYKYFTEKKCTMGFLTYTPKKNLTKAICRNIKKK